MKLVVQSFISLDGVMQAPGGPEEDRDGGFAYGGWLAPFWSDEAGAVIAWEQADPEVQERYRARVRGVSDDR